MRRCIPATGFRVANPQMGPGGILELQWIPRLQRSAPQQKMVAPEVGLYDIIPHSPPFPKPCPLKALLPNLREFHNPELAAVTGIRASWYLQVCFKAWR